MRGVPGDGWSGQADHDDGEGGFQGDGDGEPLVPSPCLRGEGRGSGMRGGRLAPDPQNRVITLIPSSVAVGAFIYDVDSGLLEPVC